MSFLKSLFAVSLTGASSVGGTLIYQTAVPGSGKDVLIKEGYYILDKDDYYKAAYEDNKEEIKKIENFKDKTNLSITTAATEIKPGCETELAKPYVWNQLTKKNLVSLCTSEGIVTVKARLIANNQTSFIIDEQTDQQDKKYKIVFAVYKYSERLSNFFSGGNNETNINKDTEVEQGYSKLKTACETGLKKKHKEVEDVRYFRHISGWCSKFEYETFESLAQKRKNGGTTDSAATNKGSLWKHTEAVTKHMLPSENGGQEKKELDDDKVKNWCTQNKTTPLHENNNYQEKFVVFLSVCQGTTDSSD